MAAEDERDAGTGRRDERTSDRWLHAFVGAVVTVVTAFIPFSPVLGGGVAGYLQRGTDREGLRVGALSGAIASVPVLAIFGLIFVVLFFGIAVSGEVAGPLFVVVILLVIAAFVVGYTVVLSAVGGLLGAALAESRDEPAVAEDVTEE